MGKLKIDVLGTSFEIQANGDDAYLEKLLGYYKSITDQFEKSSGLKNQLQISILAGITLVDQLYREKGKSIHYSDAMESSEVQKAEKLTLEMINKLNQALES